MKKKNMILNGVMFAIALGLYVFTLNTTVHGLSKKQSLDRLDKLENVVDSLESVITNMQLTDTMLLKTMEKNGLDINILEEDFSKMDKRVNKLENDVLNINLDLDSFD